MAKLDGMTIKGDDEPNRIKGAAGKDRVYGLGGDDFLLGHGGNDRLFGGSGDDTLTGGEGKDSLTGGSGADRFVFVGQDDSDTTRADTIRDFEEGTDKILFRNYLHSWYNLHFIGTHEFTGVKGEVRFEAADGVSAVSVDLDGNQTADMLINFVGEIQFQDKDFSF